MCFATFVDPCSCACACRFMRRLKKVIAKGRPFRTTRKQHCQLPATLFPSEVSARVSVDFAIAWVFPLPWRLLSVGYKCQVPKMLSESYDAPGESSLLTSGSATMETISTLPRKRMRGAWLCWCANNRRVSEITQIKGRPPAQTNIFL